VTGPSNVNEATELPVANPSAELPHVEDGPRPISLGVRVAALIAIIVPLLGVIAAPFVVWGWGFLWTDLGLLLGLYALTASGITVGYHRLFVHRSFETTTVVKFVFAVLGSMAVQGPLLKWVAMHRVHHQHADKLGDPHSPQGRSGGVAGILAGLWHAHIGWLFDPDPPELDRYVEDLRGSQALRVASVLFPLWAALGLLIPAVLGGLITRTWTGLWTGLIWGGLVRIFLVHHVTWSVNSACHLWGLRPFRSDDESRNNAVFGVLAMGEGWHNTHHAFPTSARHGLRWWQIDVSYWVIWMLARLGLAWNVKTPSVSGPTTKTNGRERSNASRPLVCNSLARHLLP
jgi:stearoyl-CoA desaturase (delta-9 desaturase)